MRNKIVLISAPVLVLAVFIFSVVSFNSRRIYKNTEFLMDTYVTIQAVGKKAVVLKATKKAFKRMSEVDEKFNMLKSQSPIYAFNKKSIPLTDPEIIRLIKTALEVSNKTGGAFDVTIKPLIELWGFYSSNPQVPGKRIPGKKIPGKKDISEILKRVNYRRLVIKNGTLKKRKKSTKTEIDPGGIAKGYALDEAARVMRKSGIKSALIDAGGDIIAIGSAGEKSWRIGIKNPRGEGISGIINVTGKAVVTSGDYERFFMSGDERYHHILNPQTGYPAGGLASVTVIADNAELADAWSTALFVLGKKRGFEILKKMPGIQAVIIDGSGDIFYTPGAEDIFTRTKNRIKEYR